jgi:hypothetical protein
VIYFKVYCPLYFFVMRFWNHECINKWKKWSITEPIQRPLVKEQHHPRTKTYKYMIDLDFKLWVDFWLRLESITTQIGQVNLVFMLTNANTNPTENLCTNVASQFFSFFHSSLICKHLARRIYPTKECVILIQPAHIWKGLSGYVLIYFYWCWVCPHLFIVCSWIYEYFLQRTSNTLILKEKHA